MLGVGVVDQRLEDQNRTHQIKIALQGMKVAWCGLLADLDLDQVILAIVII